MKTLLPSLLVSLLAVAADAQDRPAAAPFGFDLSQAHGVVLDDDGVPLALGDRYKASFVDGAIEFVPMLGATAPHNRALRFRLQTVAVGETLLHVADAAAAAAATIDGNRVQYARGPVLERYDATPRGVEQSFVLARRPDVAGDLVVRGAVTTTLAAARRADGTLFFSDGTTGGVTVGGVTGVDAHGARCPGTTSFVDGVLELRLPAAFVAAAEYPLVLDPLLGTLLLPGAGGGDDSEPVVAYERSNDVWLVVWRRTASINDQDLRAQRIAGDGTLVGGIISIFNSLSVETRPAVATVDQHDRFVVAWQTAGSAFGPWSVRVRSVSAATGAISSSQTASTSSGAIDVAICGDRSDLTGVASLVWHQMGVGVLSRTATVDAAGAITLGPVQTIAAAGDIVSGPGIGKSNVPTGVTLVTWETEDAGGRSLFARPVGHAANPLSTVTPLVVDHNGPLDHAVDGDGQQFVVAHLRGPLFCSKLTWNGSILGFVASSSVPGSTGAASPAIGWLGDRYLVAWQQATAGPFDNDVLALALNVNCVPCSSLIALPTSTGLNQVQPAIGAQTAAGGAGQEALIVWNETSTVPSFVGGIAAHRFVRMVGAPPVVLSPSCAGGGTAGTAGPFALGNQQFKFTLAGGDPAGFVAVLALSLGGPPTNCGCDFTQLQASYATLPVGGATEQVFPVPCNATLLGAQLEAQWILLGVAASPCPFLPNLTGSNRLRVTITE